MITIDRYYPLILRSTLWFLSKVNFESYEWKKNVCKAVIKDLIKDYQLDSLKEINHTSHQ